MSIGGVDRMYGEMIKSSTCWKRSVYGRSSEEEMLTSSKFVY